MKISFEIENLGEVKSLIETCERNPKGARYVIGVILAVVAAAAYFLIKH